MSAAADALMGIFGFKRVEGEQMKTIEQTRRELFEVWLLKHKPIVAADMLEEGSFVPEWMFEAWCAALDAVEIQLPSANNYTGCNLAIDDCRAAIEQTGLGLRVK